MREATTGCPILNRMAEFDCQPRTLSRAVPCRRRPRYDLSVAGVPPPCVTFPSVDARKGCFSFTARVIANPCAQSVYHWPDELRPSPVNSDLIEEPYT